MTKEIRLSEVIDLGPASKRMKFIIKVFDEYSSCASKLKYIPRWQQPRWRWKKIKKELMLNHKVIRKRMYKRSFNDIHKKAKQLIRDNKFYLNKFEIRRLGLKIRRINGYTERNIKKI